MTVTLDRENLRRVYRAYPRGVAGLAGLVGGSPRGLTASSFTPVSAEPPLVSVCVARTSSTWAALRELPRVGISVLSGDQEDVCRQLASRTRDRFAGLGWSATRSGAVLVDGAAAWLECSVEQQVPAGDHVIVVFRVHALDAVDHLEPLVYHASGYRRLAAVPSAMGAGWR